MRTVSHRCCREKSQLTYCVQ